MIGLGYNLMQLAVRQNNLFVQPVNPILEVLAKFGADAHMWLPGVGAIDGVDAKNWIDSGGTQAASINDTIGKVDDSGGGSVALVQAAEANRPTLKVNAEGHYYWEFVGLTKHLPLSVPVFQMSDDMCIVAGVSLNVANSGQAIFAQSNGSNHALPELMFDANGRLLFYVFGGGTILNISGAIGNAGQGSLVASALIRSQAATLRMNGVQVASGNISGAYTTATKAAIAAFPTVNPSEFLPGNIYPVIAIKGTVSNSDLQILEQWIGGKI